MWLSGAIAGDVRRDSACGITGWLREALETVGMETRVVAIPEALRKEIVTAQQQLVNPARDELAIDVDT